MTRHASDSAKVVPGGRRLILAGLVVSTCSFLWLAHGSAQDAASEPALENDRIEIEYVKPLLFRTDPVHVNIWVTGIGGSSFDFGYEVAEPDGSAVYALAASSMVLVNRDSGVPVRLSPAQRHALEQWKGEAVPFRRRR